MYYKFCLRLSNLTKKINTFKYLSYTTLLTLNVPCASISITVLKALNDNAAAGAKKFPAAPIYRKNIHLNVQTNKYMFIIDPTISI